MYVSNLHSNESAPSLEVGFHFGKKGLFLEHNNFTPISTIIRKMDFFCSLQLNFHFQINYLSLKKEILIKTSNTFGISWTIQRNQTTTKTYRGLCLLLLKQRPHIHMKRMQNKHTATTYAESRMNHHKVSMLSDFFSEQEHCV